MLNTAFSPGEPKKCGEYRLRYSRGAAFNHFTK